MLGHVLGPLLAASLMSGSPCCAATVLLAWGLVLLLDRCWSSWRGFRPLLVACLGFLARSVLLACVLLLLADRLRLGLGHGLGWEAWLRQQLAGVAEGPLQQLGDALRAHAKRQTKEFVREFVLPHLGRMLS